MSSLLELDFSLTLSEATESMSTASALHSRKRDAVWKYSRCPKENEDQAKLYCSYCKLGSQPPGGPYGTNLARNLKKHISKWHPDINIEKTISQNQEAMNRQIKQLYHGAQAMGDTEKFDIEVLEGCLDITVITKALITLIIVRNLSYTIVEWPEFYTLCQVLNRACEGKITTTHSIVANKVKQAWGKHKDVIRRVLQLALSHIHIALDIWTSPNRYLLLAICAHFTTYDGKRQKALLALQQVPNHSGEAQFLILLLVLKDYDIVQKLGTIISDNASTNNVLCRFI
jgi:hypothetical protein